MTPSRLRWLLRAWPPFVFSGIRVTHVANDWSHARVELRERWYNRNYVGTHFGGSLFAMTDPFWMILLLRQLGAGYRVWDRAAQIEFVKPGRGTVVAAFLLDPAEVDAIRAATAGGDKHLHWFTTAITDADGEVVARVRKQVYVRRARPEAVATPPV
ncbi:MAG: DUF4442 domain-containing protein [Arenimonas sp.]